ncbi:MAG: SMP-30/gluconolactonase/LRE family protein [Reichenbachiella sp.]
MNSRIIPLLACVISILASCDKVEKTTNDKAVSSFKPYVKIIDEEGHQVIDENAEVEILAGGFNWTEGPLCLPDGNFIFSDIPENKIYQWSQEKGVEEYLKPSGTTGYLKDSYTSGSNGLLLSPNNELVLCQHGDRRVAIMNASLSNPSPDYTTLVDNYQGKRLNSPNDAVYHSNGDLYFTDPPYGLDEYEKDPKKELDFQGVYRLKPDGQLDLLVSDLKFPNGIGLSKNEKTLYVANSDYDNIVWMAYDLDENGLVKSGTVFYDANKYLNTEDRGNPDGLEVNKQGYVLATGPGGLWIFNENGKELARVYTGQLTSNCALSTDEKYIYMTADDYIMRVKLKSGKNE